MNTATTDRRRSNRAYFSHDNRLQAIFAPFDHEELRLPAANIMDLSAEGLGIAFSKNHWPSIQEGDELVLVQVLEHTALHFIVKARIRVQWVLKHRLLDHNAAGGEFIALPLPVRIKILQYIENWNGNRSRK